MKKTLTIIKIVAVWLVVAIAVAMMIFTIVSVSTFDRNDRSLFGYKMNIVLSDSMSSVKDDPEHGGYFDAGDLIFVREVDPATLQLGDIIAYTSTNTENFGETVTHMIKELTFDAQGNPAFVTYGTSTGVRDDNVVTYAYVIGKYTGRLPKIGTFFQFLKTTPGYIVCILLPFLSLIGVQGFNSIQLFRKYKAEQLAELEAQREKERAELQTERDRIEKERKKQEEMIKQLLRLQAAMKKSNAQTPPAEEDSSAT